MMKKWIGLVPAVLFLAVLPALSLPEQAAQSSAKKAEQSKSGAVHNVRLSAGETKFAENCSRCHNAPQGFSPRISGTILRHMRVRASLSKQDEQDILHFLNP